MAFTDVWDVLQPPDSQLANLLGQDLRNLKTDIQQRMGATSGSLATRWDPSTDTQPTNWTGVLYFTTDTNQIFRWSGAAWVDVSSAVAALPALVRSQTITNQAASSGSVILYTVPASGDGLYRITLDGVVSVAGSGGTLTLLSSWNNGLSGHTATSAPLSLTTLGNEISLRQDMYVPPGQNITYTFTLGTPAGSPRYGGRVRLEYLGV
jgi:hypothetical protein